MNSAVSPHQTIPMPPPGFPHLSHQTGYAMHPHMASHHLAGPPGVPHHMLAHMGPYAPSMMPTMVQMELMSYLPQWGSVHMSFQMQTQMLSRIAQTRGPYQYPHFMGAAGAAGAFGGPFQPLSMGDIQSNAAGDPGQLWPHPSMPKFNPAVPPPETGVFRVQPAVVSPEPRVDQSEPSTGSMSDGAADHTHHKTNNN